MEPENPSLPWRCNYLSPAVSSFDAFYNITRPCLRGTVKGNKMTLNEFFILTSITHNKMKYRLTQEMIRCARLR